jgi:hypothetical protein
MRVRVVRKGRRGCGIGGGDFLLAREYGADVLGVDLSRNMLVVARERAALPDAGAALQGACACMRVCGIGCVHLRFAFPLPHT